MYWQPRLACVLAVLAMTGCLMPSKPFYFRDDGDLSHYKAVATEIEEPDVDSDRIGEVDRAAPPLTLSHSEVREIWPLTLQEAIHTTLANSKVIRSLGIGIGPVNNILQSSPTGPQRLTSAPESVSSTYRPAQVDADPRFGTEAALSTFDAQFTTSMFWEKNDRPVNFFIQGFQQPIFQQDLGTHSAELSKRTATGGQVFVRNRNNYELNNNPANLFHSIYNAELEAEFRHPLLQGAGTQFNRVAGSSGVPGFYNGVIIARITHDIALADLEANIRNLVAEVEAAYWRVYYRYRDLDAKMVGRDSALQTWRIVRAKFAQVLGGEADKEAQAREQYFFFRNQVEQALSDLYGAENNLRYLMGLAASDGRLIRPSDEPTTAHVKFDWYAIHTEALARSIELRQQRWRIKQADLQLMAAKNFLMPRLDVVGRYRWRGMGEKLFDGPRENEISQPNSFGVTQETRFNSAYQTLTQGDFQESQLGFQMTMPIGFRREMAGVRSEELRLARERALLQDQELELSHQLSQVIRDMVRDYTLSQTNFNRRVAAQRQVEAVQEKYQTGTVTLDLVLDAQRRLAEAETAYYLSLSSYNIAIAQVHFRKGSLLEYNGVYLAEGPWPEKAYLDAYKRANERDAGLMIDYGFTRPNVLSRGVVEQEAGTVYTLPDGGEPTLAPPQPEEVPLPASPRNDSSNSGEGPSFTGFKATSSDEFEAAPQRSKLGWSSPDLPSHATGSFEQGVIRVANEHPVRDAEPATPAFSGGASRGHSLRMRPAVRDESQSTETAVGADRSPASGTGPQLQRTGPGIER